MAVIRELSSFGAEVWMVEMYSDGAETVDVRAVGRAMASVDPALWRDLPAPRPPASPIPVTHTQWVSVLTDSELLQQIGHLDSTLLTLGDVMRGGSRRIGRKLVPAVHRVADAVRRVCSTANDVLWFEPPEQSSIAAVSILTDDAYRRANNQLDRIGSGRQLDDEPAEATATASSASAVLAQAISDTRELEDPVERMYGVSGAILEGAHLRVGGRLRVAFHGRDEELSRITEVLLGFILRDRVLVEDLDGSRHPFALATDGHPLVAHRAARAACDLVHLCAAADLAATAAVIVDRSRHSQTAYSSHRGLWQTLGMIAAAEDDEDDDARTRAIAEFYRAVTEGPLRMAAAAVLRLLGDAPQSTAGLNEIQSRLLVHRDRSPLCAMIADVVVPSWRNARAHEGLHWDPEVGTAMFGDSPADLDEVQQTAFLAWSVARGFEAGVQVARGCLPALVNAIEQHTRPDQPVSQDMTASRIFADAGLCINRIKRRPSDVVLAIDPVTSKDGLIRVMRTLTVLAVELPHTQRWTVEFGPDLPDLTVTGRAGRLAAALCESDRNGNRRFLYPPTFSVVLADALQEHGLSADEAAAQAWDLSLRDSLTAASRCLNTDTVRRAHLTDLRQGARRTNTAVRAIATHLGIQPPVQMDLTALCAMVRRLERRTSDEFLLQAIRTEHYRLTVRLGPPPPAHPWAGLGITLL